MTKTELLKSVKVTGLRCSSAYFDKLVRDGLLRPATGGERGRGKAAKYTDESLLRLQVLLQSRRPPLTGFGLGHAGVAACWGTYPDAARAVDPFLPAFAYLLGLPGVGEAQARSAALRYLEAHAARVTMSSTGGEQPRTPEEAIEAITLACNLPDPLPAIFNIALGSKPYRRPEIYRLADVREGAVLTLRDEIVDYSFPLLWRAQARSALDPEDLAAVARLLSPTRLRRDMRRASPETLQASAFAARFLFFVSSGSAWYTPPKAPSLLIWWALCVSSMRLCPDLQHFAEALREGLPADEVWLSEVLKNQALQDAVKALLANPTADAWERFEREALPIVEEASDPECEHATPAEIGGTDSPRVLEAL